MNIIFLDIDGVLNNLDAFRRATDWRVIDPPCVTQLNRITDATGAQIVITSSWRFRPETRRILIESGVTGAIIGITPELRGATRGDEISTWLHFAQDVGAFIILDDDNDMGTLSDRLVRTDPTVGLTHENADRAIGMFVTPEG